MNLSLTLSYELNIRAKWVLSFRSEIRKKKIMNNKKKPSSERDRYCQSMLPCTHKLLLWLQDRMYPKGLINWTLEFHINGPERAWYLSMILLLQMRCNLTAAFCFHIDVTSNNITVPCFMSSGLSASIHHNMRRGRW